MKYILAALMLTVAARTAAAGPHDYELDAGRESVLLGGAAGLFVLGRNLEQDGVPGSPDGAGTFDPESLFALDRSALRHWSPGANTASDVLFYTVSAAPLGLLLADRGGQEPGTLALMYAETYALQGAVVYLLKSVTRRPRPFVHNPDPRIPAELRLSPTARRSFPSGHTASTFAAAVFAGTVHARLHPDSGARPWIWAGGLAAATTTAVMRYRAGRHHPTDLAAGALIGALAGWVVPRWHETETADPGVDPEAKSGPAWSLAWGVSF